jgi:hypothetical protein
MEYVETTRSLRYKNRLAEQTAGQARRVMCWDCREKEMLNYND